MELLHNLALGFSVALTPANVAFAFIGAMVGTLIGVLPGIGPIATIAMLLPLTFKLEPTSGLIMLAGIFYGAQYGGSTTAILVNLPGETSSVVTCIDGHQMARQGRAGAALAVAALASFFAGCISTALIATFAPPLAKVGQSFGSPEYFSLMVLGLIAAVVLAHGSVIKAVAMIILGLLVGLVGTDGNTGGTRFTFGIRELTDGIDVATLAIGVFGVGEIITNLAQSQQDRSVMAQKITRLWPTREDFRLACDPARHRARLGARRAARRRRHLELVRGLRAGEEVGQGSFAFRPRRGRGRGRPGIGQQCRRADLLHSHADLGHPGQCRHGADDRRPDDPRHPAGSADHGGAAEPVLGHDRLDVDRQPHAGHHQPAADRHVGAAVEGAVSLPLPGDPVVLRYRRLH